VFEANLLTFEQAHSRYRRLRLTSYEEVARAAHEADVRPAILTELDAAALQAWQKTWSDRRHWTGDGGYRWDVVSRRYCHKPRSLHAAMWSNEMLCGMVVGWVSEAHERLTLHFLESSPDPRHPLRGHVTFLAFAAAESYGRSIGARVVALRNPLPGVVARYASFGYELARTERGNLYYHKQLT